MKTFNYWPYDEVRIEKSQTENCVFINSPWLKTEVEINKEGIPLALNLGEKISKSELTANDFQQVNAFFSTLSAYPFCYILPRAEWENDLDVFKAHHDEKTTAKRQTFLQNLVKDIPYDLDSKWGWDFESALQFSATPQGLDPYSVFSVARRYHLLSSIEAQTTEKIYEHVNSLSKESEEYKNACALMTRQNHFVTQKCHESLLPALSLSERSKEAVQEFIDDEYGHDRILDQALKSFVESSESIPVMKSTKILMGLLKAAGRKKPSCIRYCCRLF